MTDLFTLRFSLTPENTISDKQHHSSYLFFNKKKQNINMTFPEKIETPKSAIVSESSVPIEAPI